MRSRFLAASVALGALTLSATVEADHCDPYAEQPFFQDGSIQAVGSWNHCDSNAKVTVLLRKDVRWWPDSTLRKKSKSGTGDSILLVRPCTPRLQALVGVCGNEIWQQEGAVPPCRGFSKDVAYSG